MKLSMIKLFLLSFTFIACNKEGNEQNGLDSLKYKSFNTIEEALLGTEDADLILSFAYNYNSTSNRFYSFNNSAFFQKTKNTQGQVFFNDLPIAKVANGYANNQFTNNQNSTEGYKATSEKAIGTIGRFKVINSPDIADFISEIYITKPIIANFVKVGNSIQINWSVDDKIDNDIFGVELSYELDNKYYTKSYAFSQITGNSQINVNELKDIVSGTVVNIRYSRGIWKDININGKNVRTIAYTFANKSINIQ